MKKYSSSNSFFNLIIQKNQEVIQQKTLKYGYDFELDSPLLGSEIRQVIFNKKKISKPNSSKENSTKYILDNVSFDLNNNINSLRNDARNLMQSRLSNELLRKE